jgi:hypothetical protein
VKILFPDTNFFIQCRDGSQINWNKLFPDEQHILLVIPKAVADEIDRQKQDGNTRRAKQARKANSFFREIILSETGKVTIKESKPTVEATFSPPNLASCSFPDFLDLGRNDDQIIAEILRYKATEPGQEPSLLTHDTNPLRAARLCGLTFVVIPDEWLLEPEPDTKDKRILDLERKVKELQAQGPLFEVTAMDECSEIIQNLEVDIPYYPELTEDEITNMVGCVKQELPMETNFPKEEPQKELGNIFIPISLQGFGMRKTYVLPSEAEIEKYQRETYPQWLKDVKAYFQNLAENLTTQNRTSFITFCVNNFGSAAAENALIEFHALGDVLLICKPDAEEMENILDKMKFPSPPAAPKGYWKTQSFSVLDNYLQNQHGLTFESLMAPPIIPNFEKRDKNEIYWKPRRPEEPANYWCFECDEFRHQIEKEYFLIGIDTGNNKKELYEGAVRCVVSAKNLVKPVEHIIKIKGKRVRMDTKQEIMAYYRKEFASIKYGI